MSRDRQTPFARGPEHRWMFIAGVVMVLGSVAVAAWTVSIGDVVTALSLGLLAIAGALIAGIGFSPEAAP